MNFLVLVVIRLPSRVQLWAQQASLFLTIFWSLPKFRSIASVMPSRDLILWHPLLLLPSMFPSIKDFSRVSCLHHMTKILELQHQSFQWVFRVDFSKDWLVWSPCCPRDFQESPPAPQFKFINFLVSPLFYGPAFTTIGDHWEDNSLDCTELYWQSNTPAFKHTV